MSSSSELWKEVENLKRDLSVQSATQSGAQATQGATQAGQASTQAAAQAGMWSTMIAGFAAFIIGIFLGLMIARTK